MANIKAIQLSDKILVFINGKKEVVKKSAAPETFNIILDCIKSNEQEKIKNVLSNTKENIVELLGKYFKIKFIDNKLEILNENNEPYSFTSLILRKTSELISYKNKDLSPIKDFSEKLIEAKKEQSSLCADFFSKVDEVFVTKFGNIIIPVVYDYKVEEDVLIGEPKKIYKNTNTNKVEVMKFNHNSFNLNLKSKNNNNDVSYALINPFDITNFLSDSISVTRTKIIKNLDKNNFKNGIYKVENEELFEIPYNIYKEI